MQFMLAKKCSDGDVELTQFTRIRYSLFKKVCKFSSLFGSKADVLKKIDRNTYIEGDTIKELMEFAKALQNTKALYTITCSFYDDRNDAMLYQELKQFAKDLEDGCNYALYYHLRILVCKDELW